MINSYRTNNETYNSVIIAIPTQPCSSTPSWESFIISEGIVNRSFKIEFHGYHFVLQKKFTNPSS